MSQDHYELHGSRFFELRRVDRILSELARPALEEDFLAPSTKVALAQIGICVGGDATRRDLIERLWSRKRSLLRQAKAINDWGPFQPVA
ncbi:MAG TPA: hypothetical protein VNG70_05740 [Candidatus Limnocylindria bacterium]|jgi:hypothetical protein|nr:hypothetical protein [Candidatus Limnocylindria bacterium]